jgi:hypothetical protein
VQVRQVTEIVEGVRAARAPVIPTRVEHEVLDDQLPATLEQVQQCGRTVGALKGVLLLDLDHRQRLTLGTKCIARSGGFLLSDQQFLAGSEPLVL